MPPLRQRKGDILELAHYFLARHESRGRLTMTPAAVDALVAYDWPGNVRELENMIKRFVILQDEQLVIRELNKPRLMPNPAVLTPQQQEYTPAYHAPPPEPAPPASAPEPEDDEEEAAEAAPAGQDGRRLSEVALAHLEQEPPDPRIGRPELSPDLGRIVLGALAKSPDDRPRTGAAFAHLLRAAAGSARA